MNLVSSFIRRNWDRVSRLSVMMKGAWLAAALVAVVAVGGTTFVGAGVSDDSKTMNAAMSDVPQVVQPSTTKTSEPTPSSSPSASTINAVDITPDKSEPTPSQNHSTEPSASPSASASEVPELIEVEEVAEIAPKAVAAKAPVTAVTPSPVNTPVAPAPDPVIATPVAPAPVVPAPSPVVVIPSPTPTPAPVPTVDNSISALQAFAGQQIGNDPQQLSCLITLWNRESNWNYLAENPWSGAYGIPQALPGYKMSAFGSDWQTNPRTQILWGVDYIKGRYGTSCKALDHSNSVGWY